MAKPSLHIDRSIGRQLRVARMQAGLSQQQLGERVELTFQQIQKYESGKSRISAAILAVFARELDVPLLFFFGDDGACDGAGDGFSNRPLLELSRLHARLSERRRRVLVEFAKILAEEEGEVPRDGADGRPPQPAPRRAARQGPSSSRAAPQRLVDGAS